MVYGRSPNGIEYTMTEVFFKVSKVKSEKVSGISNIFSGVADFTESTNNENDDCNNNQNKDE